MQLSHSKIEKYLQCPRSYDLHYNQKLRPTIISSALWFGNKLGLVIASICLRKKDNPTPEEIEQIKLGENPLEYFDDLLEKVEINDVVEQLDTSPNIRYYRKDFCEEILTKEDLEEIQEYSEKLGLYIDNRPAMFPDFIQEYLSYKIYDADILSFMNLHFFLSLRRKGRMFIQEFLDNFFHKIVKVHSIEREIKIDMSFESDPEFTDFMLGFIDIECDYQLCETYDKKAIKELNLKDGEIIRITSDFKTSSARYGTKKLTESKQLARYNFIADNPYVGYMVFVKELKTPKNGLRKGESFFDIQVIFGERSKDWENQVLDEDEIILEKIQNGEFPRILEKDCKLCFGKYCDYFWYCNDDFNMNGLIFKRKDDIVEK